jgi:hypothetical protein
MTTTRSTICRGSHGGILGAMLIATLWVATASAAQTSCHPAQGGHGDPFVYTAGVVTERIQWWAPANSCACPAVQCSFLSEASPPCQVSCGARQSAVCQCATC